jgi:hypothetical protein
LPADAHIADMGSGKGYLTFALYDYMVNSLGMTPHITGIELRQPLVGTCNQATGSRASTNFHSWQGIFVSTLRTAEHAGGAACL